jgi:hypothetical protein
MKLLKSTKLNPPEQDQTHKVGDDRHCQIA